MGKNELVAESVISAVVEHRPRRRGVLQLILHLFATLLAIFKIRLAKVAPDTFKKLREEHWGIATHDYLQSFENGRGLKSIGDMGFSGSTFFETRDAKYLIKSVPRHSEHSFFKTDLLEPYEQHMASHHDSLLVRVLDFLGAAGPSVGRFLSLAPSHHIVMENILFGKEEDDHDDEVEWKTWDLKPTSYFYPERDFADGRLTSEATKDQLADTFNGKIILTKSDAQNFFSNLNADTEFLARHNAVDYSLFLVRTTYNNGGPPQPSAPEQTQSWRTGMRSCEGRHVFRAVILDFFWAKHKPQPIVMTGLVRLWDLVTHSGPMSITTTPEEYRERFLQMCRGIVEIRE